MKSDKKIKRKVGAFVVLGIFAALMLAQPVAATNYLTGAGGGTVGISTTEGRIYFDDKATDEIEMLDVVVGIGETSPGAKLDIKGTTSSSHECLLNVKNSAATSVLFVRADGRVGIGETSPEEKLEINGNILFHIGGDRSISVESYDPPMGYHHGYKLTISSGDAFGAGTPGYTGGDLVLHAGNGAGIQGSNGGDVYIYGGLPGTEASAGRVILAHTGSAARGRVGIGTDNPIATLDVAGYIRLQYRLQSSTGMLDLCNNIGRGIFIDDTGFVGLGTHQPATLLELSQEGNAQSNTDFITITNEFCAEEMDETETSILFNQWYWNYPYPWPGGVDDAGRLTVGVEPGHNWWQNPATHDSYMAFQTSLDGTVDEKVRITSEGRVGIGTTSPTGYAVLHLRKDSGDNAIAFSVGDDDADYIMGIDATDSKFKIHSGTALATTSDFTITTDGNVGIGTSSPDTELHVNGDIKQKVTTSDVNIPLTDAQLDTLFGTPASNGDGWTAYLKDSDSNNFYQIVAVGTQWYIFEAELA